jgi:hypothetical protein
MNMRIELEFDDKADRRFGSGYQATILLKQADTDFEKNPLLTRRCSTMEALNEEIIVIEKRLDAIRREAETKFRDAKNAEKLTFRPASS